MALASGNSVRVAWSGDARTSRRSSRPVFYAVGSRSEAVRLSAVVRALGERHLPQIVTQVPGPGDVFDPDGIPRTERLVEAAPHTEVQRVAQALAAAEKLLIEHEPTMIVVAGDGERPLAFALAAAKLGIQVARIG